MMRLLRFRDWSLRMRLALLLLVASVIPLTIAAVVDIQESRRQLVKGIERLLVAGATRVANELDAKHDNYEGQAARVASLPDIVAYCLARREAREPLGKRVQATYAIGRARDKLIRSFAMIDGDGRVALATDPATVGLDLSSRKEFRAAIKGSSSITGLFVSSAATGSQPTVAYLAPVRAPDGRVVCVNVLSVHADAFWTTLERAGAAAGSTSYAAVLDANGVRIAHGNTKSLIFHPAGPLPAALVDELVAAKRFGPDTRRLLEDVRSHPNMFELARAAAPAQEMFRGVGVFNGKSNYGVARRLKHVHWTVVYQTPEDTVSARLGAITREKALLAVMFIAIAAVLGMVLARGILGRVRLLGDATARLAAGETTARVPGNADDELGRLGAGFNAMADRIESQSLALQRANADLEARVRERSGLLDALVENSPAAIVLKNLQGQFLLVNERAARVLRSTRRELIGKSIDDVMPKAAADRIREVDASVVLANAPVSEELLAAEATGIHTYLDLRFPVHDEAGSIYAIGHIAIDITDRSAAEDRLRTQLARMNLLDQITTAIGERQDLPSIHLVVIRSLEDQFLVDFCCILDYEPEENMLTVARVGTGTEALAAGLGGPEPVRIPVDQDGLSRCVGGELVYESDISGGAFPFQELLARAGLGSVVMAPLMAEGRVLGVLVIARRQTNAFASTDCEFLRQLGGHVALAVQQAQLNENLRRSQQTLLQQERLTALGQMASGIAHDINNAISPVALYTETLLAREPGLSPRTRSYLEIISRAIDDVASTVARMREFYRPREQQAKLLPLDLNELVQHVIDLTQARWGDIAQHGGAHIELVRDLEPGLPRIMGVESEVREAMVNLVFNAVDAMPSGGDLTLRTRSVHEGQWVELDVIDTGVGMDEETRRRCLEPFFTTKGERGSGLGLAMVYGVAQRHDALVDIDSEPGRGTRVRISFLAPASVTAPENPGIAEVMPQAAMRLLLVDDDPLMLKSMSDTLGTEGHLVTCAPGGQAGIDAFIAALGGPAAFDVVITDLGMAHVDGRQVAAAVKKASAATPVIMVTGWGQRMADDGELPPHVDKLLAKPPKLRALREALAEVRGEGRHA